MKKTVCIMMAALLVAGILCGCGKAEKRELYNVDLTKYVTLGDYKGLSVDKKSSAFQTAYDKAVENDVSNHDFYIKKTSGAVESGDTVNIDYVGKKDGVAFDGGTAQGYDLTIGSGQFIQGFEDGLIGKEIGTTVDLNLTFPENYDNADLAGKAVVFTVTLNYVKTTQPMEPKDYYKELGFKSEKAYQDDVTERAVKMFLTDSVKKKAKVKDYPKEDSDLLYNALKKQYEQLCQSQYGITFADMLSYQSLTEEDFKKQALSESIYPTMQEQMTLYAIKDKEKIQVTEKDISAQLKKMKDSIGSDQVTEETIKEYYGDYYFEMLAVTEKVEDYLYQNAKIK